MGSSAVPLLFAPPAADDPVILLLLLLLLLEVETTAAEVDVLFLSLLLLLLVSTAAAALLDSSVVWCIVDCDDALRHCGERESRREKARERETRRRLSKLAGKQGEYDYQAIQYDEIFRVLCYSIAALYTVVICCSLPALHPPHASRIVLVANLPPRLGRFQADERQKGGPAAQSRARSGVASSTINHSSSGNIQAVVTLLLNSTSTVALLVRAKLVFAGEGKSRAAQVPVVKGQTSRRSIQQQ